MKRLHIFVFLLFCQLTATNVGHASFENRVKVLYYEKIGEKYYRTREIRGNLDLAIRAYTSALNIERSSAWRFHWKIARCYWMLGTREREKRKRLEYFALGVRFGERAVNGNADSSQSHLWYGMSLGSAALERGVMNALYQKDRIRSELQKALSLNPKEVNALLGLAGWYYHVPQIFGGDRSESFRILKKALSLDPNFTATYLLKARLLIESGQTGDARRALLRLLKVERPTSTGSIEDRATAKILLEQMNAG